MAADRLGARRHPATAVGRSTVGRSLRRAGEGQDRSGGTTLAEPRQRRFGRFTPGDHHGGHRGSGGRFERLFPTGVHLHHVEQGPDHPVDPGQQFGPGGTPGLVEGTLEGVSAGGRAVELLFGLAQCLFGHIEPPGGPGVGRLGFGHGGLQLMAGLLGLGQALAQLVVLALEQAGPTLGGGQTGGELVEGAPVTLEGVLQRMELTLGDGDRLFGPAEFSPVAPGTQVALEFGAGRRLGLHQFGLLGSQRLGRLPGLLQLLGQTGTLGLERRDHVGVSRGVQGLGQRPLAFPQHAGQAPVPAPPVPRSGPEPMPDRTRVGPTSRPRCVRCRRRAG